MVKFKSKPKIFKDPIHDIISLPNYCVKVIDTPEFQRLRHIKQLTAESVYPGATHNRFGHSIGVCHLAGEVIKHLKENQPELIITKTEVECVQLAGLCHDLGHGPLSHKFESIVKRLLPEGQKWKHEHASVEMLDYLNKRNKVNLSKSKIDLIKDLISGKPPVEAKKKRWNHYRKRRFLYQIVANKDSGIDVDKWDYFARDCHYLGVANNFDHKRVISHMRVCKCKKPEEDGREVPELCFRDKLMRDVSAMFAVRWDLHDRAYQHRVVKLVEEMYAEALYEYFKEDGKKESPEFGPMMDVIHDMRIYSKLDDQIIGAIARSTNPELRKARDILHRIQTRDLYQCIGEIPDADSKGVPEKDDEIQALLTGDPGLKPYCTKKNLVIINHEYNYGKKVKQSLKKDTQNPNKGTGNPKKGENPLKNVYFYTKKDDTKGSLLSDEKMPPTFNLAKTQLRDVMLYTRAKVPKKDLPKIKQMVERKITTPRNRTPAKQLATGRLPHTPKKRSNSSKETNAQSSEMTKTKKALF